MLKLQKLTKQFWLGSKPFTAVNSLSLEVATGQVFGFIGLNGAGKTTTIKMITGLLFPDSGQSSWKKQDSTSVESKKKFGFMPEHPQFHRHLSATEVLSYVGELFEIDPTIITKRTKVLLKQVGLADSAKIPVRNFSKGMRQRLGFAVALINNPELLILDEPLDGLDPIGRAEFKKLILEQKAANKTIFLSSHILSDIDEICDQIAVIDKGKLLFIGSPKKLTGGKKSLEAAFVELVR
ncbi:MAG: ABC transporter ATP-binding protein [Patescibacteria group bacterium]